MTSTTKRTAVLAAALPIIAFAAPSWAQGRDAYGVADIKTSGSPITAAEVESAQRAWGDALVAIATEHEKKGHAAAKRLAETVLDTAYGYNLGPVAFKPTLAAAPTTFRTTRDGALAYFVGGDTQYPDSGFALKGWRAYEIDNAAIVINGTTAISTGNVTLTDAEGKKTVVDKTWGYVRDADGKLRIVAHHSSLPYQAK